MKNLITKEELIRISNEIDEQVKFEIRDDVNEDYAIRDGIFDIDKYFEVTPKILWVLKDAHEDGGCGDWDLKEHIRKQNSMLGFLSRPTYKPMAHIAYGVYKSTSDYNAIKSANEIDLVNAFQSIAYINIKKIPITDGGKKTIPNSLQVAYKKSGEIIRKQIRSYVPDFVIAGGTADVFFKDFGIMESEVKKINDVPYYFAEGKFFLPLYHPSYYRSNEDKKNYATNVISAIQELSKQLQVTD